MYENTKKIARKIQGINSKYSAKLANVKILDPRDSNPPGFTCTETVKHITEVVYDEEIICYKKTVPNCSKVTNKKYRQIFWC
jgi:hypothetical protein